MSSSEHESLLTKAKTNVADLFRWKTRVQVIDIHGNETVEWQSPQPRRFFSSSRQLCIDFTIVVQNPISLFRKLTALNWLFFIVGLAAWTADGEYSLYCLSSSTVLTHRAALDFHTLSIKTTEFSKYYHVSKTSVTTAITLTLLLRSIGAALFVRAIHAFVVFTSSNIEPSGCRW